LESFNRNTGFNSEDIDAVKTARGSFDSYWLAYAELTNHFAMISSRIFYSAIAKHGYCQC